MADEEEEFDYTLVIDGVMHGLMVDDLELWEVEVLEESGDCGIEKLDWDRASTLRAMAFLVMHRKDAGFTMNDARLLKLARFKRTSDAEEAKPKPRPTKAAKKAA